MEKQRSNLKILYIQIRDDEITKGEELDEFARYSELEKEQFTVLNVFDTPDFAPGLADGFDGVFVGGSSDASVLEPEKYPFVKNSQHLLEYCLEKEIPVFASCFGFQVVVTALGGDIILDKENMEMGTYDIRLTEEAKKDLLLHDTPEVFSAISGHKERATKLPEGSIMLAYSELCPYHAIKIGEKPFYAFQFHPEVDGRDLVNRITRYMDRYLKGNEELELIRKSSSIPTSASNILIKKFVDRVILREDSATEAYRNLALCSLKSKSVKEV